MKKAILLTSLLLSFLWQGNAHSYSDGTEMMNKLDVNSKGTFQKNKTRDCDEYAEKNQGKYSRKTVYEYCCTAGPVDYHAQIPQNAEPRIKSVSEFMQKAKNECRDVTNECFKQRLKEIDYQCN